MDTKRFVTAVLAASLTAIQSRAPATADTHLFPVIAANAPNLVTLVSVGNRETGTPRATHFNYIYRFKNASKADSSPNTDGTCDTLTLLRPTSDGDLVTFDASGYLNGGNAMFGDTNDYGGSFNLDVAGPVRAYLLVSNADSTGIRVNGGHERDVFGDFMVMDIAGGGAWGGKGVNDKLRHDYDLINARRIDEEGVVHGGVYSALPANGASTNRRFTFLPPNEWTTRFFVTPIGADMHTANREATVGLFHSTGVFDRQGNVYNFAPLSLRVVCTGAIDLHELMDSTTWSAVENVGGWARFEVSVANAIVYKLEYALNDATYGGTVNNGYLLSGWAMP